MAPTPITGDVYGEREARQRTRDFLLREAERPISELLKSAESALAEFEGVLDGVSSAQAAFKPGGEGEEAFSIAKVARHVAGSGAIMASRLRSIGLGESPTRSISPGNFGDVDAESLPELADPLNQVRIALQDSVRDIDGHEQLEFETTHPMFGKLNSRAYLRLIGLHFEDHTRQVARIKSDPRYPAT
jgi:hypothetical protein